MIKYLNELEMILDKFDLSKDEIILVGGVVLAVKNLRKNNDLDFSIIDTDKRKNIKDKFKKRRKKYVEVSKNIDVYFNRYSNLSVYDDDLNNEKFYFNEKGFKIVSPEIEFAYKISENINRDLPFINKYISENKDCFDWDLFRECIEAPSQNQQSFGKKYRSLLAKGLINPTKAIQFFKKEIRSGKQQNQYSPYLTNELTSQLITKIHTSALLGNNLTEERLFLRYDVIMRYLTIDAILNGDKEIIDIYKDMQKKRVNRETLFSFKNLIDSIENNGFRSRHPIPVNRNGQLLDGSHRLACALYFDIDEVPVEVKYTKKEVNYGKEWFVNNGIEKDFIREMEKQKRKLFLEKGIYFPIMLWPPVKNHFKEILDDISSEYEICYDCELDIQDNFEKLVREIYAIDDIDKWKVELKLNYLKDHSNSIYFILIKIPNVHFREKNKTVAPISTEVEDLKNKIRKSYKDKIDDYFYDIIIHMGDNYIHNKKIIKIFEDLGSIEIEKNDLF